MARTLSEIREDLQQRWMDNSTFQTFYGYGPGLAFENVFSLVSFENTLIFVFSFGLWTLEKLFDQHKEDIENRSIELEYGQLHWYRSRALEFQYGDPLVFLGKTYGYNPINEANKVIQLASADDVNGIVVIKCANIDGSGNILPLSTNELTAANTYMNKIKYAGIKVAVISRPADLMKLFYHVYYDPLVLNPNGSLISDNSKFPVVDAINEYCKFMNYSFNATFSITELTDKIQAASGVINPVFDSAAAKFGTGNYQAINDYYKPNAGYSEIDPAFPLSTTITYQLA